MAIKTMNLAKLPVWFIVGIQIFHLETGEAFKWFKGGCSNYTFHAKSPLVTWERSKQLCRNTGLGALVSIESEAEWMFLKNTVQKLTIAEEYFIGLKEDDRSRQWRWLSNKSTSQTSLPWATGEPNGEGKCVIMYKDYNKYYGEYNDVDCTTYTRSGYICELPVDNCNQDDRDKLCSCYTFENYTSMPWSQAQDNCRFHNKHLVVMETEREWEFINYEVQGRKSGKENEWHIGLYRNLTTNKWIWVNGKTETLNKWQKDKPQNVDFYAVMAKESPEGLKGSFRSIRGDVKRGWICEEETDNCQGVCLNHNAMPTTSTLPGATTSTQWQQNISTVYETTTASDTTKDPEEGKQAYEKNNCYLSVIILASLVAVLSVALIIFGVCLLSWRKKQRKDSRKATHKGNQLDNQDGSLLSSETAARQLGFFDETERHGIELEYQRQGTVQNSRQWCEYAMLTPRTMMVPGDSSYASLVKSKQEDCTNGSSVAASPLLQQDEEPHDELPTYINVHSAKI